MQLHSAQILPSRQPLFKLGPNTCRATQVSRSGQIIYTSCVVTNANKVPISLSTQRSCDVDVSSLSLSPPFVSLPSASRFATIALTSSAVRLLLIRPQFYSIASLACCRFGTPSKNGTQDGMDKEINIITTFVHLQAPLPFSPCLPFYGLHSKTDASSQESGTCLNLLSNYSSHSS
jgi:hypothetical protein